MDERDDIGLEDLGDSREERSSHTVESSSIYSSLHCSPPGGVTLDDQLSPGHYSSLKFPSPPKEPQELDEDPDHMYNKLNFSPTRHPGGRFKQRARFRLQTTDQASASGEQGSQKLVWPPKEHGKGVGEADQPIATDQQDRGKPPLPTKISEGEIVGSQRSATVQQGAKTSEEGHAILNRSSVARRYSKKPPLPPKPPVSKQQEFNQQDFMKAPMLPPIDEDGYAELNRSGVSCQQELRRAPMPLPMEEGYEELNRSGFSGVQDSETAVALPPTDGEEYSKLNRSILSSQQEFERAPMPLPTEEGYEKLNRSSFSDETAFMLPPIQAEGYSKLNQPVASSQQEFQRAPKPLPVEGGYEIMNPSFSEQQDFQDEEGYEVMNPVFPDQQVSPQDEEGYEIMNPVFPDQQAPPQDEEGYEIMNPVFPDHQATPQDEEGYEIMNPVFPDQQDPPQDEEGYEIMNPVFPDQQAPPPLTKGRREETNQPSVSSQRKFRRTLSPARKVEGYYDTPKRPSAEAGKGRAKMKRAMTSSQQESRRALTPLARDEEGYEIMNPIISLPTDGEGYEIMNPISSLPTDEEGYEIMNPVFSDEQPLPPLTDEQCEERGNFRRTLSPARKVEGDYDYPTVNRPSVGAGPKQLRFRSKEFWASRKLPSPPQWSAPPPPERTSESPQRHVSGVIQLYDEIDNYSSIYDVILPSRPNQTPDSLRAHNLAPEEYAEIPDPSEEYAEIPDPSEEYAEIPDPPAVQPKQPKSKGRKRKKKGGTISEREVLFITIVALVTILLSGACIAFCILLLLGVVSPPGTMVLPSLILSCPSSSFDYH